MKVLLTYFKTTGKFYDEGEFETAKLHLWEIFDDVRAMQEKCTLPGLIEGAKIPYVAVNVPDHEHAHPFLAVRTEWPVDLSKIEMSSAYGTFPPPSKVITATDGRTYNVPR